MSAAVVVIDNSKIQLSRMVAIRQLIDIVISANPTEEVEANMYSARMHVVRAISEQCAEVTA